MFRNSTPKILVIAEDLRCSGTSEGIVSRSFLSRLRSTYPLSEIDLIYLKTFQSEDYLSLLPCDRIETYYIKTKPGFFTKWVNRVTLKICSFSYYESKLLRTFVKHYNRIDHNYYDTIFVRSTGLKFYSILALKNSEILRKSIINFHDPFPLAWYPGIDLVFNKYHLRQLMVMTDVVKMSMACMTPSSLLSQHLRFLFQSKNFFYTIPHQFVKEVFPFSDIAPDKSDTSARKIVISYHGAIMFGRNIDPLLDAYIEIIENNPIIKAESEFILRLRGQENCRLRMKYAKIQNIKVLDEIDFLKSFKEQQLDSDILIIIENGDDYSITLMGKSPVLASLQKPILVLSPPKSELRTLISSEFVATVSDRMDIKTKLERLILKRINNNNTNQDVFGDYFSQSSFDRIIKNVVEVDDFTKK